VTKATEPLRPFERLGEYEVLAPISEGGMASVWLGRSPARPAELVALKVIRPEYARNKDFVAMLVDEARIASRLSHPNILSVRSLGHDDQQLFLVMELLRGRTFLRTWRAAHAKGKRLPLEIVAWIGARVADALHCAHELKDEGGTPLMVAHRDVNPANIFLTKEGVPKLIDFGLAKARDAIASTALGVVKGKLAYLAPEQAQGHRADRRSDVFALGVTMWEVSLDRRLFLDDSDVETIRRVREAQVPDPTALMAGYPPALANVLVRALARKPEERWQTAAELRDALDAFVWSTGHRVDAPQVRALSESLFAGEEPAAWEHLADEAIADQEKTRVWKEPGGDDEKTRVWEDRKGGASRAPQGIRSPLGALPPKLAAVAGACALAGAVLVGLVVRGCRASDAGGDMEHRVARIEGLLGIGEAGAAPTAASLPPWDGGAAVASADDDRVASCALAKVAGYQAWQEALARAKVLAGPAEAACASYWTDARKQACYRVAMTEIRTTQAARDAIITGGIPAREAVKNVKDNAKNEAIAPARAASDTAFAACESDGGT
jgi:serine/threonine-protein kinase